MKTVSSEKGAQMIIDLQAIAGIREPKARALRSWKKFAKWERESTIRAHTILCKKEEAG